MTKEPSWRAKAMYVVFALALAFGMSAAVLPLAPPAAEAVDPQEINTLRIYGACEENAAMPYTDYRAPFVLADHELDDPANNAPQIPPKDFIQWNPAYMYHLDGQSAGIYGNFYKTIKVNGFDANEKVHLRQWYVPKYEEPSGLVFIAPYPDSEYVKSPDIVKEYTYIMLDPYTNDPIFGNPGETRIALPISDQSEQIGLDDFDVNGDGEADLAHIQAIGTVDGVMDVQPVAPSPLWCPDTDGLWPPFTPWVGAGTKWMDINTATFGVAVGDIIRFMDHAAVVTAVTISPASVTVDLYYSGNSGDELLFSGLIIPLDRTLSAGRHQPDVAIEDLTAQPPGPPSPAHPITNPPSESGKFICGTSNLKLVKAPWYLQVTGASAGKANIIVGRLMTEGEAFFVDGAEYEVARIYTVNDTAGLVVDPQFGINQVKGEFLAIQNDAFTATHGPIDIANLNPTTSKYFADCDGDGTAPTTADVKVYVNGVQVSLTNINLGTGEISLTSIPLIGSVITIDYCYNTYAFKYITIRNGLPKFDDVELPFLSIIKTAVQPLENLPLLPPFNLQHDIIDDTNIPDCFTFVDMSDPLHPQHVPMPDVQLPDNLLDGFTGPRQDLDGIAKGSYLPLWGQAQVIILNDDDTTKDDTLVFAGYTPGGVPSFMWKTPREADGCGDVSFLPFEYNSIDDRWIDDVAAIVEQFEQEGKEPRFDTNLLEEKFTENSSTCVEDWMWKNIETMPWLYTEMILPRQPDITDPGPEEDDGDYILVSSWLTEDTDCVWNGTACIPIPIRMKFVYDAEVGQVNSADIYVQDDAYNQEYNGMDVASLRIYGKCNESAAFPYEYFQSALSPQANETPRKDFIQWNPAYMYHNDPMSNDIYGDFFKGITVDNTDGNEKVHLRQWYVPKYMEPSGIVWFDPQPVSDCQKTPDIVKEYTYLLLDANNDPKPGKPGHTSFVLPIADNSDQCGLDDYDVNNDGDADLVFLETVSAVDPTVSTAIDTDALFPPYDMTKGYSCIPGLVTAANEIPGGTNWIDISAGKYFHVEVGDVIRFLDHAISIDTIVTGATPKIGVTLYYIGNQADQVLASPIDILLETTLSAGRDVWDIENLMADTAATGEPSPSYPPSQSEAFVAGTSSLDLVQQPWYCQLRSVSGSSPADYQANIMVGRLLTEGESFFVDGAEYEIAKIHKCPEPVDQTDPFGTLYGLKYITLRNGLPKVDDVTISTPSIVKCGIPPCTAAAPNPIPLLPPFNMVHDIIDDVNIPDAFSFIDMYDKHYPQPCPMPDVQLPDNEWYCDDYADMDSPYGPATPAPWGTFLNDDRALADDTLVMVVCAGTASVFTWVEKADGFGDISFLPFEYNTIAERRVMDQDAAEECWKHEQKEPRFDTNFLEEKFTENYTTYEQLWRWKNIETLPWDYTEFVLPEIDDITDPQDNDDGDYIVVSSFMTEDTEFECTGVSATCDIDITKMIRMKFAYDAKYGPEHKTGLYVNTIGVVPECSLVADADGSPDGHYTGYPSAAVYLYGSATGGYGAGPYTYDWAWDLDNDGIYDDSYVQNPIVGWEAIGDYPISVRVNDALNPNCWDTDDAVVHIVEPVGCSWSFPHGLQSDPTAVFKRVHGPGVPPSANNCDTNVGLPTTTVPADLIVVWYYDESIPEWLFWTGWPESTLWTLELGSIYDIIVWDACTWQLLP